VTGETDVASPSARAVVGSSHYADVINIPNGRLWSRRRRDSAGGSGPRALKDLLKQVEKAAQVRRSGLDQVLAELQLHRDAAPDPEARSALAWLCNALSRFVRNPTAAHAREMVIAADAVKRGSG
jgi:hypothetical protein